MTQYDTKTSWPMRIGLLLAPLMFLFFLEIVLRFFGIGADHPLYFRETVDGKEVLTLNRQVTRRYFDLPDHLLPEMEEQSIPAVKAENELRIVCVGGSTTAGFPYEINATYPFQLEWRLRKALMDNKVDVINLGISAVNSYTFVDLMPEILELQPDALLIYMGHNEFYGALGVASTQGPFKNRWLTMAYLKARRLYAIQLLRKIVQGVASAFAASSARPQDPTLMRLLTEKQTIPVDSDLIRAAGLQLQENLTDMIETARRDSVYVLVSNLVVNLKDHRPFVSQTANAGASADSAKIAVLLNQIDNLLLQGDHAKVEQLLGDLANIDSTMADLAYFRGRTALQSGDTSQAYRYFEDASDLDRLRFRAPRDFNRIIREVAKNMDVPFLDMSHIFNKAAGGVPGRELFHEHLHPTFDGYRLMAQAFFEALYTIQFNNPLEPVRYKSHLLKPIQIRKVLDFYRKENGGITNLDLAFGHHRVSLLLQRWPFRSHHTISESRFANDPLLSAFAIRYINKELYWDAAHYELADYYGKQGDLDAAIREYRAVHNAFPENTTAMMKVGDLNMTKGRHEIGRRWYVNALQVNSESAELLLKAGHAHTMTNMIADAGRYLQAALRNDTLKSELSDRQRASAFYLLGVNYANSGNYRSAREAVGKSLQISPGYAPAEKLLRNLP